MMMMDDGGDVVGFGVGDGVGLVLGCGGGLVVWRSVGGRC